MPELCIDEWHCGSNWKSYEIPSIIDSVNILNNYCIAFDYSVHYNYYPLKIIKSEFYMTSGCGVSHFDYKDQLVIRSDALYNYVLSVLSSGLTDLYLPILGFEKEKDKKWENFYV